MAERIHWCVSLSVAFSWVSFTKAPRFTWRMLGGESAVRKVCSHFQTSSRLAGLGLSFRNPISLSVHPRSAAGGLYVCVCVRCFPCCLLPTTRAVLVELLEWQFPKELNLILHLQEDLLAKVTPWFFIRKKYFLLKCSVVLIYYEVLPKFKNKTGQSLANSPEKYPELPLSKQTKRHTSWCTHYSQLFFFGFVFFVFCLFFSKHALFPLLVICSIWDFLIGFPTVSVTCWDAVALEVVR